MVVGFSGTVMGPDEGIQEPHDHNRVGDSLGWGQERPPLGQAGAQQAQQMERCF